MDLLYLRGIAASILIALGCVACDSESSSAGSAAGDGVAGDSSGGDDADGAGSSTDGVAASADADGAGSGGEGGDATDAAELDGMVADGDEGGQLAPCGNGAMDEGEECDDGNGRPLDGCADCQLELGWACAGAPSECEHTCGNGVLDPGETCDDGNDGSEIVADGCDAACAVERGWECEGEPSTCSLLCGNGVLDPEEGCDGGPDSSEGCSSACQEELGWACTGEPSECSTTCGDGLVAGAEACDDEGTAVGDGCSDLCTQEKGYVCEGQPSQCAAFCGDGIIAGEEKCDDGKPEGGDGCSDVCVVELGFSCSQEPSICIFEEELEAGPNLGLDIPTGTYDGTITSMACVTWTTESNGFDVVESVTSVSIGLTHARIGDLTIKVTNPAGVVVTLVSRPGWAELADNGQGSNGDNSNVESAYPLSFSSTASTDAEAMGQTLGTNGVVCKDDFVCEFLPNSGMAGGPGLEGFAGTAAVGEWKVCAGDSYSFDSGVIGSASIALRRQAAGP